MAYAFGAFGRVDFVDFFAQINRFVWTFRFTHIAVDAFVGDHQCHGWGSAKVCIEVMSGLSATDLSPKNCRAVADLWAPHLQSLQELHTPGSMRLKWTA
jgi:hypothetical protein